MHSFKSSEAKWKIWTEAEPGEMTVMAYRERDDGIIDCLMNQLAELT